MKAEDYTRNEIEDIRDTIVDGSRVYPRQTEMLDALGIELDPMDTDAIHESIDEYIKVTYE